MQVEKRWELYGLIFFLLEEREIKALLKVAFMSCKEKLTIFQIEKFIALGLSYYGVRFL